jgi:hypothetical protein
MCESVAGCELPKAGAQASTASIQMRGPIDMILLGERQFMGLIQVSAA